MKKFLTAAFVAAADTSANVRFEHPVSVCHAGLGSCTEHALPESLHAVSSQPRLFCCWVRTVPPIATTYGDDAGYWRNAL